MFTVVLVAAFLRLWGVVMGENQYNTSGKNLRHTSTGGIAFKKGNPGRPKGSKNKLGEAFVAALQDDFKEHGVQAISKVREERPDQYLRVIASILPKDLNVNHNPYDEVSDDELVERIRQLDASIRPFLTNAGTDGLEEGVPSETTH